MAISTAEVELDGATGAIKKAIWLSYILSQLLLDKQDLNVTPGTVLLYSDNQGAIALAKNPQFYSRTKDVDIHVKFLREKVADETIDLQYTPTEQMVADRLIKALDKSKFEAFRAVIDLEDPTLLQGLSDLGEDLTRFWSIAIRSWSNLVFYNDCVPINVIFEEYDVYHRG